MAFETWLNFKQVRGHQFAQRRPKGLPEPDLLPHPDDVVLDFATGNVEIRGPLTKEEKVLWDYWREMQRAWEDELRQLQKQRQHARRADKKAMLDKEIAKSHAVLRMLEFALNGNRAVMQFLEQRVYAPLKDRLPSRNSVRQRRN